MVTKEMAVAAKHGDQFYTTSTVKGEPKIIRCRVTGKCKTWATRPSAFRLPVKYGLRDSFYITQDNAAHWAVSPSAVVLEVMW